VDASSVAGRFRLRRGRGRLTLVDVFRDLFGGLKTQLCETQLCVDHTSITPDLFACAILCSCSWT